MPIQSKQQPPYYKQGTSVQVYVATLTQTGTDAPAPNIIQNTIGTITWTRQAAGLYKGELPSSTENGTLWGIIAQSKDSAPTTVAILLSNNNEFQIFTDDGTGTGADDYLSKTPIEIRIYNP